MNLTQLIEQQAQLLTEANVAFGHGTTNAWDEAVWLTLWKLDLPLDTPLDDPAITPDSQRDRPVSGTEADGVRALIRQRIQTRKPAAYLTQEAWLQGVPFYVDERVIVPRSLIAEVLAEGSIDLWLSSDTTRVLDMCTGNGSLAILAAMAWPDVRVTGADLSTDALEVARINVARHGLEDRITLVQSDGWAAFATTPDAAAPDTVFDLILCNPPYVNAQSMAALPPEYRAEPDMALSGNMLAASTGDGMDFIRPFLAQAAQHLSPDGVLVLEIGHEREHFEAAFSTLEPVWLSTSAGDDHVLLLTRDMLLN